MATEQDPLHIEDNTEKDDFLLFDLSQLPDDKLGQLQKSTEDLGVLFIHNPELVAPLFKQLEAVYNEKARRQGL